MRGPAVLLAAALAVAGCAHPAGAARSIDISVSQCGQGWRDGAAGQQHLVLHNTDSRPGEVQLVAPASGAVYADVEPLAPATTTSVDLALNPGRYALHCLMEDEDAVTGPVVTLTGTFRGGAPGVVPVTQADLVPATQRYQRYVTGQLPTLAADVRKLQADLGDRHRAEQDWVAAHVDYERLGAAYQAFGELDEAIDGLPYGLPGGVHDPHWTGFHRIEYGLWHGEPAPSLRSQVTSLGRYIAQLRKQFATAQIDPLTLTIRAHEIVENALQFALTGADDFGSGSDRATVGANLDGTRTVLDILGKLVPNGSAIAAAVNRAQLTVRHGDHEQLDAAISELAELLAPVAAQLEPRRTG